MKKNCYRWNQNPKANFVSKSWIRKANDLLRKMKSPYVKDKSVFASSINELYSELLDKNDNRRILFRNLKDNKIYVDFLKYVDIPNNPYRSLANR